MWTQGTSEPDTCTEELLHLLQNELWFLTKGIHASCQMLLHGGQEPRGRQGHTHLRPGSGCLLAV